MTLGAKFGPRCGSPSRCLARLEGLARQIVQWEDILSTSIPVPAGVAKSVNRSLGGAPFGIRETEGRPLGHLEIRVAQVASPAAFWTFEGWDGVRLRHFNIWGPESNPLKTFSHIWPGFQSA